MPKYKVYGTVTGGKYLGVYEAPTKEKAEQKALMEAHVDLCHQCADECEDGEITEAHAEEITNDKQG